MSWLYLQTVLIDAAAAAVEFGANWLLQSTLLVALGLVAGRLLQRRGAAVQSAIYRTTLAAVFICPIASWMLALAGASGWSLAMPAAWTYVEAEPIVASAALPAVESPALSEPAVVEAALPEQSRPTNEAVDELSAPAGPILDVEGPRLGTAPQPAEIPAEVATPTTFEAPGSASPMPPTFSIHAFGFVAFGLAVVWLLFGAVLLARLATAWWLLFRLRRGAVPADAAIGRSCRELAAQLGVAAPEVLCSPYLPSPCLVGLRKPAVLLPEAELSLSIRDVLVHELAHLARHDCHWNLLRQLALSVFFFQPLLWILSRRLETTAEEVCDDYVVEHGGDRYEYAHRLVDIAELSTAPMAAAGVGIVSLRSMLAQRVQRIMDTSRALSTRVGSLLLAVVLTGGLLSTLVAGLVGIGAQGRSRRSRQWMSTRSVALMTNRAASRKQPTTMARLAAQPEASTSSQPTSPLARPSHRAKPSTWARSTSPAKIGPSRCGRKRRRLPLRTPPPTTKRSAIPRRKSPARSSAPTASRSRALSSTGLPPACTTSIR